MRPFIPLLLALFLASCAAPTGPQKGPLNGPLNGSEKGLEKTSVKPPAAVTGQPQKATGERRSETSPPPDRPAIKLLPPRRTLGTELPAQNAVDPQHLIGMLEEDLLRVLGPPDFKRRDPPAEIWQYRKSSCLLDLFLYQDKERSDAYAVNHVEARGLDINRVSGKACLLSVLRDRNQG